ncbi:1-aminocyclopropane-1-carboxylate deaminase/D-cysteine desulfhydrase [Euzebyella saccharophila]|uniref:1-aminocyclopropane-1-carboxylate deaminase/D-cysteine desulfhydrase n=1 Tax=Euzebyella saccharophila TaxID=679664 RepID=A0ABV8JXJ3_9FLAO|nr:pyridoxal-phosphate dependent enzyme [Euzebyella saccharophila]
MKAENQEIHLPPLKKAKVSLWIKREDLLHPQISGNKYRKLKYNILEAQKKRVKRLLTFGGAFSNHIAATAYAGKLYGLSTVGVIRGEELASSWRENPTLMQAYENGMEFKFVSRQQFRLKNEPEFIEKLKSEFGAFYLLPEGGTNPLAIKGCEEIISDADRDYDYICVAVGTGGTISGMSNAAFSHQKVLGFPALKGNFLQEDICKFAPRENWKLIENYHFGGYAKVDENLVNFINDFKKETEIPLDPIYTGKMMYGILDMVNKGFFRENSRILAVHTGGLQGIKGMNENLKKKNLPLLCV